MNLTLNNDDSLPLLIENVSGVSILLSDPFISPPYTNRSTQPTLFFKEPSIESMRIDQFEDKSLDELMMEFRDAVLDSNPFSSRPSFPSVYTTSSMFAVRPLSTIPTVNEEYGSRSGTKSGYVSVGGSSSINNDVCMGDSDKSAVFSRIHDCLSSTGTRSDPNKLLVLLRDAPFRCPVTNRDFSNLFEHCSVDDLGAVIDNMKVFETSHLIMRSGKPKQGFSVEILPMMASPVTHCFLVLGGNGFMDTTSERATVFGLTKIPEMKVKVKKKKKKISVGHVLGFDALDSDICSAVPSSSSASSGSAEWAISLNCETAVTLCSIPLSILQMYVGSWGRATSDTLRCFLQSALLWRDIVTSKMEEREDGTSDTGGGGGGGGGNEEESERFRTAARTAHGGVSGCARVRVFSPGAKVFTQGHCSLVRTVKSKGSTTIEIDAHDHHHDGTAASSLIPGDFIFLDGEKSEFLDRLQFSEDVARSLYVWGRGDTTAMYSITARDLLQHRFGKHRHALVCKTRVEVCCIPIYSLFIMPSSFTVGPQQSQELRGCMKVLLKLAALSDTRYHYLHMSDEALLQRHCEEERWTSEKKKLIRQQISNCTTSHGKDVNRFHSNHSHVSHPTPSLQLHSPKDVGRRSSKFSSPRESKLKNTYKS